MSRKENFIPECCPRVFNLVSAYGEDFVIKRLVEAGLIKLEDLPEKIFQAFEKELEEQSKLNATD